MRIYKPYTRSWWKCEYDLSIKTGQPTNRPDGYFDKVTKIFLSILFLMLWSKRERKQCVSWTVNHRLRLVVNCRTKWSTQNGQNRRKNEGKSHVYLCMLCHTDGWVFLLTSIWFECAYSFQNSRLNLPTRCMSYELIRFVCGE